ncbi:MAG: methionine-R-sulfoxide reductase [Acidobacteriaceae bacterium]|jgi:peptide-methionine (R)-S-oxide reductase|nr:methionine-R-sulfoxide reductase [Acidobacteriaceae bacterium]
MKGASKGEVMFDSELDRETSSTNVRRRAFLGFSLSAAAGLALWSFRKTRIAEAAMPAEAGGDVTVIRFSDDGQRLEKLRIPKVVRSEDDWRKQLSPGEFEVTRHADTEFAFSGKCWNLHDKGLYRCVCCDNALFSSETKFESGTGWPSFWQPIASENVREIRDSTFGMVRTAVSCTECDAHLGHVFDDGPEPTHLRYCMNSASLRFVKKA